MNKSYPGAGVAKKAGKGEQEVMAERQWGAGRDVQGEKQHT